MFILVVLFNSNSIENRTWYEYFYSYNEYIYSYIKYLYSYNEYIYSYIDWSKVHEIHTSQWWFDLWSNHHKIILIGAVTFICIGGMWYMCSLPAGIARVDFYREKADFLNVTHFLKNKDVARGYYAEIRQINVWRQGEEETLKNIQEILDRAINSSEQCSNCTDYVQEWAVTISSYILRYGLNVNWRKKCVDPQTEVLIKMDLFERIYYPNDPQTALLIRKLQEGFYVDFVPIMHDLTWQFT